MAKCDWMTPADLAAAYKEGINNCGDAFNEGINNPRQNPIEAAIAAINAGIWERETKANVDKWAKKLSAITLEQWKAAAAAAAATYAERAATVGSAEYEKYYAKAKPVIEAAVAKFLKSQKTNNDILEFWKDLQKLREL